MLAPIHVDNSGQLLGTNGPVCVQFTARNSSSPLRCNWSGFIQVASGGELLCLDQTVPRMATRHEQLVVHYLAILLLAATVICVRELA